MGLLILRVTLSLGPFVPLLVVRDAICGIRCLGGAVGPAFGPILNCSSAPPYCTWAPSLRSRPSRFQCEYTLGPPGCAAPALSVNAPKTHPHTDSTHRVFRATCWLPVANKCPRSSGTVVTVSRRVTARGVRPTVSQVCPCAAIWYLSAWPGQVDSTGGTWQWGRTAVKGRKTPHCW